MEQERSPWLSVAPEALHGFLRFGRAALFRLAGPVDSLLRHVSGRGQLPPLWLRRQAGPLAKYESSAREMAALIERLGLLRAVDRVLDIGCGTGVMAAELKKLIGPERQYLGFDVHPASIRWCKRHLSHDPRFRFELAAIVSPYGSRTGLPLNTYRFPMANDEAGFVLAKSVFTHLLEPEARHYLSEIERVLQPGKAAVVTAFLYEQGSATDRGQSDFFPFSDSKSVVRWRFKVRPHAAVAFERAHFLEMVRDAGLRLQWLCPGFLPGESAFPSGQDILILGH